ncbi:MAG TPA: secondary thiamine-phosphate synthase enzyme YjbQ [Candidatus Hydrogenedens sp.]|nr:secondary thiamine-phosphate synthase enzyme YjbQ [Candidatus Hydrogenedens sp.]
MKIVNITTSKRTHFIPLDSYIEQFIQETGIKNGIVCVYVPHTTAGITINENADPDVLHDIDKTLDTLIPWNGNYKHAEGNSPAHVKASLMGSSVQIIIQNGKLVLGTWQSVFFCEFDGPRTRKFYIEVIPT